MEPSLQLVTLGVPDVAQASRFYAEGLGWPVALDVPGEVTFLQIGHGLMLGLFGSDALAKDSARPPFGPPGAAPLSLAQIVQTPEQVRAALDAAHAAGGTIVKAPQQAAFGGYHGYFTDPFGFLWEVATNPGFSIAPNGTVSIRPV